MIYIECITTGAYQENCYLIWDSLRNCLVIDPGEEAEKIKNKIIELNLNVYGYICTHGHADHISALHEIHKFYPSQIAMHELDLSWSFLEINQSPPYYNTPLKPNIDTFTLLEDNKNYNIKNFEFKCIHTPGHTPGSCCLYFKDNEILISGDTLFKNSCGRTDMRGGNGKDLRNSLNRLKELPKEVRVYPGHGESTTIKDELENNFFMK